MNRIALSITMLLAALSLLLPAGTLQAVTQPPTNNAWLQAGENIFLPKEVSVVEITMDEPGTFNHMYSNPHSDDMYRCTIRWRNSKVDEVLEDVGIRPRGNTSRGAARKAWKLDINEFVSGRRYHGLKALNLYGEPNDPTLLRRMLAHEFMFRMGLPTQRTNYVAMYVDDTGNGEFEYRGMKVNVEHVDDRYIRAWFGNRVGDLYKARFLGAPADLTYRADGNYAAVGGGETYEEKNNAPDTDYSDLAFFIDFIHHNRGQTAFNELEHHFNIDNFLRYLATNVAIGSWDDYWYGSNNYYLFFNVDTNRMEWIPYDYDNVLGIDFFNTDWSMRHFDGWGNGGFGTTPAPLVDAVFDHSEWRRQFRRYLLEGIEILEDESFKALAGEYHNLILPWFDGTIEDGGVTGTVTQGNQHHPYFLQYNSPSNWSGGSFHTLGVIPFIERRAASLRQQIDTFIGATEPNPPVYINEIMASNSQFLADNWGQYEDWIELYNAGDEDIDLTGWYVTDDLNDPMMDQFPEGSIVPAGGFLVIWASGAPERTAPGYFHTNFRLSREGESVGLYHRQDMGRVLVDWMVFPETMTDLSYGPLPDGTGDNRHFYIPTPGAPNDGMGSGEPRTPPRLFINEFMATNNNTIADNFGEYDDWIEIYNDEDEPVDLGGLFLTDTLTWPTRWQFPEETIIPAKGFLLVWADSSPEQTAPGYLHTNFALSQSGEEIGLFDTVENRIQPIHTFAFGPQETNVSWGLLPDGEGEPQPLSRPTPGISNMLQDFADTWMIY